MRAVWLREFGGPEALVAEETPEPVAGLGQVVVDVAYAGITFVETQVRAGTGPFPVKPPLILGNGVGGVVGGRRVVTSTGGSGGYAERVAVDAGSVIEVPDGLALDDAVALLADGRTATMLVRAAGIRAGERVLVEAAAGGVGTLLVQLAHAAGAQVVGVAGGARKAGLVRELGAEAVDHHRSGWERSVGPVDVVFDGVGGDMAQSSFAALRPGGRMLTYGFASGEWASFSAADAAGRGVTLVRASASPEEMRAHTRDALAEAAAGRLRPVIGQRFPLENAAEAHAAIGSRATIADAEAARPVVGVQLVQDDLARELPRAPVDDRQVQAVVVVGARGVPARRHLDAAVHEVRAGQPA